MKLTKLLFSLLIAFMATSVLISCGDGKKSEEENYSEEFKESESDLQEDIKQITYNLPSPSEVPGLLMRSGIDYNGELINPSSNVDKYTSTNDLAALNLGVFATDVGYLISHDKVQEALNYLSDCKKLGDQLGLSGSFETSFIEKFETNLNNKDSLTRLIDATINESHVYLQNTERAHLSAMLLTGSMVEGLYISTELINRYPSEGLTEEIRNAVLTDLIRVILEQYKTVNVLMEMINDLQPTDQLNTIKSDLEALTAEYEKLDIEDKIENNQGSLVFKDEHLKEISTIVTKMRNEITQ